MTHFSLKRTLLQQLNQVTRLNYKGADKQFIPHLRNSGSLSPTMLRIGKSSPLCHPNIPLKKTRLVNSVIYASAVSLKLENYWRHPSNQIATYLEKVLKNAQKALSVKVTDKIHLAFDPLWLEFQIESQVDQLLSFELSNRGLWLWTQRLHLLNQQQHKAFTNPISVSEQSLWVIQYAYSRCHQLIQLDKLVNPKPLSQATTPPEEPAQDWPIALPLLHTLINAMDSWEVDAWKTETVNQALLVQRLLDISEAFDLCHRQYQIGGSSKITSLWVEITKSTYAVLKSLGIEALCLPLSNHL